MSKQTQKLLSLIGDHLLCCELEDAAELISSTM